MSSSMRGFRCWSDRSVRETVFSDIGALPSEADAVFLAAHSPMTLTHPIGVEAPGAKQDEGDVLRALLDGVGDPHRNTLIAVTGDSGAGKSHVVRWVHAHLDRSDDRYYVLYVPRAVQTIRELLRRIVSGLPDVGGAEFMERIDAAVGNTGPAVLRDRLLEEMRFALTWTLEHLPAPEHEDQDARDAREERNFLLGENDDQGKRRNGLSDLLNLTPVNRALLREGGRLYRFVASVFEETSRRDEDLGAFEAADLALRDPGVRRSLAGNDDLTEVWNLLSHDPSPALGLLEEAFRVAAPRALGIRTADNGVTLDDLFRRSRQLMRSEGKELVLLFEDLAQFGLIDGELYDQFATQPGHDLSPLRVIFAVTDGPFKKLPPTVQTRITHQFVVEGSALSDRQAFVARYLNLVRVGREDIEIAWTRAKAEGLNAWVRNACDTREEGMPCRFRDRCHAGFGFVDVPGLGQVGLYPYNETALRRSLEVGQKETPRHILDRSVFETLVEADVHIEQGTYPHELVQSRFQWSLKRAKETLLGGRSGTHAERLYRALVIWGDEQPLDPTVAEAFALDDAPLLQGPTQAPLPEPTEISEQRRPSPLPPLFEWQTGAPLLDEQANRYRDLLYNLVRSRLDLEFDLFHTAGHGEGDRILGEVFSPLSFDLEDARGRRAGGARLLFPIRRNDQTVKLLAAVHWFGDHGHWRPEDGFWDWPAGYDPADLMLTLESQLDQWADEVRTAFLRRVQGRGLARAAVGVRAIALIASGFPPVQAGQLHLVLASSSPAIAATPSWAEADEAARNLLHDDYLKTLVNEFAAVRQGDGGPQLLDIVQLQAGLEEALEAPAAFLVSVAASFRETVPSLAKKTMLLAEAIRQAAPNQISESTAAVDRLCKGLLGCAPATVADAAWRVGKSAKDSSLFRPDGGWSVFAAAIEELRDLPQGLPLDWQPGSEPAADALFIQSWIRDAQRGAEALAAVQDALTATRLECEQNPAAAVSLRASAADVRRKLVKIAEHLRKISGEGAV